ncbi:MAG: Fe(2+)-trafficking protein [Phycisphaerales bacterium]
MTNTDLDSRIAQFQNMAQADPDNEMAHYSLANAYLQAQRYRDAAESFLRCTELAPGMSKAFQLAGDSLIRAGQRDRAADVLTRGYMIAAERGDRMPQSAISDLLRSIGKEPPKTAGTSVSTEGSAGGVVELGGVRSRSAASSAGAKLDRPPFRGPVGEWIFQNVSKERWEAWIRQGTKVINELRLDLSKEQDAEAYDQHMREYLGLDEETFRRITS